MLRSLLSKESRNQRGFTLVELLVVIAIIGVLAGLTTTGVYYALLSARQTMIKSQLAQISDALEKYKGSFGEYPPSLADRGATLRHASSRWNRSSPTYEEILTAAGLNVDDDDSMKRAASLTFWLGGVYYQTEERKEKGELGEFFGFNADTTDPLFLGVIEKAEKDKTSVRKALATCPKESKANFFAMDEKFFDEFKMASDKRSVPMFHANENPIAYFPALAGAFGGYGEVEDDIPFIDFNEFGVAVPYAKGLDDGEIVWHADKTYQLIHPGADGSYGGKKRDPGDSETLLALTQDEDGISSADLDNIVNFTGEATLGGEIEK